MPVLELRDEFRTSHMRATAIELSNRQNTGWTQRGNANELLEITYPTGDVTRALDSISASSAKKPIVMIGQRGSGKSHIMALLHNAFANPDSAQEWSHTWGEKLQSSRLAGLQFPRGFTPLSETLSNSEYPCLWDVLFDRHPKGGYFRGKFEQSGTVVPAKSLIQDMFSSQPTALIFDELQTWYDGQHDDPGDTGKKRLKWAFNFIQILSELAEDRPDLCRLIVSVRDNTTDAFQQIHRKGPVVIDFKGETARDDRKRLVLHRLFKNRDNIPSSVISQTVAAYADARVRLLYSQKSQADQAKLKNEVAESWPFSPELIALLEDHLLMAAAAQGNRDFIRMLAEVFRSRGDEVPVITPADFSVDDDDCGVTTLVDSFATTVDQERLREKAIKNLKLIREGDAPSSHAREVISSIWVRSLSAKHDAGGTRAEIQLDVTREQPVDDNAFTAELAAIVENSFNIHEVGTQEKRFCFKLPDNPESKLKAWARNNNAFDTDGTTVPGLLSVRRDQQYLRQILNYVLKTPDAASEPPSFPVILDPNWQAAPWANVPSTDQPAGWTERGKAVLVVLPVAPKSVNEALGAWLVSHISQNRNMVRFLLPTDDSANIYDDRNLLISARCALLASEWKKDDPQYASLHKKYETELKTKLKERFDRYAILAVWDFQNPSNCQFHVESHKGSGSDIPAVVEKHVVDNFFMAEDFKPFIKSCAQRGDKMQQVLALMREPPLPGETAIPYLGDIAVYEHVLSAASKGVIAINVDGHWFRQEAGEAPKDALQRLKQKAFCSGGKMYAVQLGEPSQVGGTGVTVPPPPVVIPSSPVPNPGSTRGSGVGSQLGSGSTPWPTTGVGILPVPPVDIAPTAQPIQPAQPVIRRSLGAKSGVNLLGDLEKWALPDNQRVTQATLTFTGNSIKELREMCMKLPAKIQAELQITLPPEGGAS